MAKYTFRRFFCLRVVKSYIYFSSLYISAVSKHICKKDNHILILNVKGIKHFDLKCFMSFNYCVSVYVLNPLNKIATITES